MGKQLPAFAACAATLILTGCSGDRGSPASTANDRTASAGQQPPRPTRKRSKSRFVVPNRVERQRAIGLNDMAIEAHRWYRPGTSFAPISAPKPGEWLAEHREAGQMFSDYARSSANRPTKKRRTIYIVPVGTLGKHAPSLSVMARFSRAYFGLPTRVTPPRTVAAVGATRRVNRHSGKPQLLSTDVLAYLRRHTAADAYATVALTGIDLYPEESWNFVFGQASLSNRVGVYSLARYHPSFDGEQVSDADAAAKVVLRRSLKVMAHETMHMFGIQHCIYFECVVNGSNHLQETDSRPVHACPVDLRKLQHAVGFDVLARYRALERFYASVGLESEQRWVKARIAELAP